MIGFQGRHRWRRHWLFKLHAKPPQRKNVLFYNILAAKVDAAAGSPSASKICDSLNPCAPHKM
jgi:hypothetical protein